MVMQVTTEQAMTICAADPFIVVEIIWNGINEEDDDYEQREFDTYIMATNINNVHCMDDLVKRLDEEVMGSIDDIQKGISFYLCQMRFVSDHPYWDPNSWWEIESHELMKHESYPVAETEIEQ